MYSIPRWLAEEKEISCLYEEYNRVYFDGEEIRRSDMAVLIRTEEDGDIWFPISQLREYDK